MTNLDGIATIKIKKTQNEFFVKTIFYGYRHIPFKIKPDKCLEIKIGLWSLGTGIYQKGVDSFKIIKFTPNKLTIKGDKCELKLYKEKK